MKTIFLFLLSLSAFAEYDPRAVKGPASATDNQLIQFDGTTGKKVKAATGTGFVKVTSGVPSYQASIDADTDISNLYPATHRTVQQFTATGASTYNKPSLVKATFFVYCGAGGAGGGTASTSAVQAAVGGGGESGEARGCLLLSPSSSIALNIGTGGTGASNAAGTAGGDTTISGCSTAIGGNGGSAGTASASQSFSLGVSVVSAYSDVVNVRYARFSSGGLIRLPTLNYARGEYGGYPLHPLLAGTSGGGGANGAAGGAASGWCAGGGGSGANNSSAALAGGAGANGVIFAFEYY